MRFAVLGPIDVTDDTGAAIAPRSTKLRTLLAALLCPPNRTVSVDRLVDQLWDGAPPKSAQGNLQVYVHRLRNVLGDARIVRDQSGYQLVVGPDELDAQQFEDFADAGRRALADGHPQSATGNFTEALALWRGTPYGGVEGMEAIRLERKRLQELRVSLLENRMDAELELGGAASLVPELRALAARYPSRQRFRGQLMLALYRDGRAGEALDVYRQTRETLIDELGLEPGHDLRELERAIRTEDPALSRPRGDPNSPNRPNRPSDSSNSNAPGEAGRFDRINPAELPATTRTFTGREVETDRMVRLLTQPDQPTPVVVAIAGPGGVGKSTLALRVAEAAAPSYPDGQLYVNLHGATPGRAPLPPLDVLTRFLRTLGVRDREIPTELDEAAARFRSLTSDRRLLIVLDDAWGTGQVRPLLPGGTGSSVVITSRPVLSALDGATTVPLEPLTQTEAVGLLTRLVGAERVAQEPEAIEEVAQLCGRLPLAVRIVGARLAARPDLGPSTFVARLQDGRHRLAELEHADLAVRASFAISHQALSEDATALFDSLGVLYLSDFTVAVAAAVTDQPSELVRRQLDELVEAQLLTVTRDDRYVLHDLLRLYAQEQASARFSESERVDAIRRVVRCYIAIARAATRKFTDIAGPRLSVGIPDDEEPAVQFEDTAEAVAWTRHEVGNLAAVMRHAWELPRAEFGLATALAAAVGNPLITHGYWPEMITINRFALDAWHEGPDPKSRTVIHRDLAIAHFSLKQAPESLRHHELELAAARERQDRLAEVVALQGLGDLRMKLLHEHAAALDAFRQALEISRELGNLRGQTAALNNMANVYFADGKLDEAQATYEQCLELHEGLGENVSKGRVFGNLGELHQSVGRLDQAATRYEQAIVVFHTVGFSHLEARRLWDLGDVRHAQGRSDEARARWRESLELALTLRLVSRSEVDALLAQPVPSKPRALS